MHLDEQCFQIVLQRNEKLDALMQQLFAIRWRGLLGISLSSASKHDCFRVQSLLIIKLRKETALYLFRHYLLKI